MREIFYMVAGGLFSGVILYIIKGFFTGIEDRMKQLEGRFDEKVRSLDAKIEKIFEGHNNIYAEILTKFSNWEDRIKKILDETITKKLDTKPEEFKRSILDSFTELDKEVKQDMKLVKNKMDNINEQIRRTESVVTNMKIGQLDKKALKEILLTIEKGEYRKNEQINELDGKLVKIFMICKVLISENKDIDKKLAILTETSKTKIRLSE